MRRIATLLLAGILASASALAADDTDEVERNALYLEFRVAFDAGEYLQALPLAERLVQLTREHYGADADEVISPLTNLATTLYRMEQLGDALRHYRRVLLLLEQHAGPTDPRRLPALQGTATVLRAMDRHEDAIPILERQLELQRVSVGLDSPEQFPTLRALIEANEQSGRIAESERLRGQLFNTAERAYGPDDVRMVGPLQDLAAWYSSKGHHAAARVLYLRAMQIADEAEPGSLDAIASLRGVARVFVARRLRTEPGSAAAVALGSLPRSVAMAKIPNFMAPTSDEGERVLLEALRRLEASAPDRVLERGEVSVQLGDLYHVAGLRERAAEAWQQGWKLLHAAGDTRQMDRPAMVANALLPARSPVNMVMGEVLTRLSITAEGDVADVTIVNPEPKVLGTVAPELTRYLRNSYWRPAFVDGRPVDDPALLYSVRLLVPKRAVGGVSSR